MINLEKISGLPIIVNDDYHLKIDALVEEVIPSIRKFSDMVPVLLDQQAKPNPEREDMYYMYRGIHLPKDEEKIKTANLRYDVTILPSAIIGKEFTKTLGHYHPAKPGTANVAYPELYEILHGEGLFLIQKMDQEFKNLIAVYGIQASVGDKVIYPPNYAHVIVNIGKDVLVTANWSANHFESNYEPIINAHGMAYYVIRSGEKKYAFVENLNYANHPEVKMIDDKEKVYANFGFKQDKPIYTTGMDNPKSLEFLNFPEKYLAQLSSLIS